MYKKGKYSGNDSMAQLICENHSILLVMNRFKIQLGFAEKTIYEVCSENGIDANTFLAIVNLIIRGEDKTYQPSQNGVSVQGLIEYLHNSHDYYLTSILPKIRQKLISALRDDNISQLIVKYFDDFIQQTKEHFLYEEETLFPYIKNLLQGEKSSSYKIDIFCQRHDHIDEPLTEFKDVIIKYYNAPNSDELIGIIHNLLACSDDLSQHNLIEDRLLVPLIKKIEMDAN